MTAAARATIPQKIESCSLWPERFGSEQWAVYRGVMAEAFRVGIPFAVGGGLAAMTYAGLWRNTKDIDLYVRPSDRERMARLLLDAGLRDYYEKLAYDRNWIFRTYNADTIVDLMWGMANERAWVDDGWLQGPIAEADGLEFRLLPPEEALWSKLYVLQHDRSDWPDTFNLLNGVGPQLDWNHLIQRTGKDARLLAGLLCVYAWLAPDGARELPEWLWSEFGISEPEEPGGEDVTRQRARLLDSRPWFSGAGHALEPLVKRSEASECSSEQ
ncbi:MAG: nucleotidyltransferase family protein [Acidobacteriaceae bacterium]|nr:nucleotidyltransferase family protein [Acidobacteriaceae bacterium]MBV9500678.1 nucleotidyltransferase family protein [Acidobacteriaceae bacterium]